MGSNFASWELTHKLAKFLDRHLVFPLLEFLSSNGIYEEEELLSVKVELLNNTNMVDFAIDNYKKLHPGSEAPDHFLEKRKKVVTQLKELEKQTEPVLAIITKDEVSQEISNARDPAALIEKLGTDHGLTPEMCNSLLQYAKCQYECGNYSGAAHFLSSHRALILPTDKNYLNNLWGKLACEILMQRWEHALEDFNRLREYIDTYPLFKPLEQLQQRTWLIHWSLFIFFNYAQGRDMLIEMILEKKQSYPKQQQVVNPYLNAVQTMCPHILRYLTTCIITNRKRREYMKELVKIIQQESNTYRDPITEFVECLCVNFDFDGAQTKLRECVDVFNNDFFLVALRDDFIENARLFVFETFCQIHECVSISMLAEKLNMSPEEAERWIVNLIRQARLDAKIDSKLGHVIMGTQSISPYQQLIEKTKSMQLRCQVLTVNLEKRLQAVPERNGWSSYDF